MLKYETFCQIKDHLGRQSLTVPQTARALGLNLRTVTKWAAIEQYCQRQGIIPARDS